MSFANVGSLERSIAAGTTVLHKFDTATIGHAPVGAPIEGPGGLYGTTAAGGKFGGGTIYRLAPDGTVTVIHDFAGPDGREPSGGLVRDERGAFYSVTSSGGNRNNTSQGRFNLLHLLPAPALLENSLMEQTRKVD